MFCFFLPCERLSSRKQRRRVQLFFCCKTFLFERIYIKFLILIIMTHQRRRSKRIVYTVHDTEIAAGIASCQIKFTLSQIFVCAHPRGALPRRSASTPPRHRHCLDKSHIPECCEIALEVSSSHDDHRDAVLTSLLVPPAHKIISPHTASCHRAQKGTCFSLSEGATSNTDRARSIRNATTQKKGLLPPLVMSDAARARYAAFGKLQSAANAFDLRIPIPEFGKGRFLHPSLFSLGFLFVATPGNGRVRSTDGPTGESERWRGARLTLSNTCVCVCVCADCFCLPALSSPRRTILGRGRKTFGVPRLSCWVGISSSSRGVAVDILM